MCDRDDLSRGSAVETIHKTVIICALLNNYGSYVIAMRSQKCANCNTPVEVEGLPRSFGGFYIYCKVCGHNWLVE